MNRVRDARSDGTPIIAWRAGALLGPIDARVPAGETRNTAVREMLADYLACMTALDASDLEDAALLDAIKGLYLADVRRRQASAPE